MQLPDETPKLSKLPFVIGDAALLLTAWIVFHYSHKPLQTASLLTITICVVSGAVILFIPFLLSYTRAREEVLAERQRALEALARTTAETAEQIGIAAAGLNTIAETVKKSILASENAATLAQEKISALSASRAATASAEADALRAELTALRAAQAGKLVEAADKITRATADLIKAETALRQLPPPQVAAAAPVAATPPFVEAPVEESAPAATVDPSATSPESSPAESAAVAPPSLAPKRKRAKPTETPAVPLALAPEPTPESSEAPRSAPPPKDHGDTHPMLDLALHDDTPLSPSGDYPTSTPFEATVPPFAPRSPAPPKQEVRPAALSADPSAGAESALSSDGATRLLVTAYIGIGNKLFLRGDGPGLRPDVGVPLQFVSIGKWRWETSDASIPLTVKLYKNDQQLCATPAAVTLQPGRQHEITAEF